MNFTGVSMVYLFVNCIKDSLDFYSKVLSLEATEEEENFALININGFELCFHKADDKSPLSTGGSVAYWEVDGFDTVIKKFIDNGATLYRGPLLID